jgi:hypothetical protein
MSWVAAAIIGGAVLAPVVGSLVSGNAAQDAANTQAQAGAQAQSQVLAAGQKASEQFAPYTELGKTSLASLTSQMPYWNQQFTAADLKSNLAPNYEFMKQQGLGATSENINVGGGGSNANMARTKFAEDYASNAYQSAFNNFQAQRTNIFNQNNALASMGLTGATGTANAQIGTGTNVAGITQGIGNAQAAGQIGQANAYSSGIQGVGNAATLYGLSQYGQQNAAQSALTAGGYGSNALSNIPSSAIQGSSNFIGPIA